MPRGGARPNSGPKKGSKYRPREPKPQKAESLPDDIIQGAKSENLTPLAYMLKVMNDPKADDVRRDRMAAYAAPYVHVKAGEGKGKKEQRDEAAKQAMSGKFAPARAPLKIVK